MITARIAALALAMLLAGGIVAAQNQGAPAAQKPAAPSVAAPPAAPPPPGNAEEGKKVFVSHGCYQCHGYEGQGSAATGPRLGPRPAPYPYFSSYVRKPSVVMPPYTEKVLSDADLANIYAFLQARPAPPPLDAIPLLK